MRNYRKETMIKKPLNDKKKITNYCIGKITTRNNRIHENDVNRGTTESENNRKFKKTKIRNQGTKSDNKQ